MVDTQTKLMALLGTPLAQSYSAIMHTHAYEILALNCLYMPIECEKFQLKDIVAGIRCMNFIGFNITKPHKVEIIQYLDELDDLARIIGAVNTVKKINNKLIGYNTDGIGFIDSLATELDFSIKDKTYLIYGAGGGARAIALTLAFEGAKQIYISTRNYNNAVILATDININVRECANAVDNNIEDIVPNCDCIINASGLGMHPNIEETPINKALLKNNMAVCDLTYNPYKTQLLLDAEAMGCKTLNGLGMLVNQGSRAFEIWLDIKAPIKEMQNIILEHIRNYNG